MLCGSTLHQFLFQIVIFSSFSEQNRFFFHHFQYKSVQNRNSNLLSKDAVQIAFIPKKHSKS